MKNENGFMKKVDAEKFVELSYRLDGLYDDIKELCKKNASAKLSKFMVKNVNAIILEWIDVLKKYNNYKDVICEINHDDLPEYADVQVVINQIRACYEGIRTKNIRMYSGNWIWNTDINDGQVLSYPPKGVKK